MSIPIDAIPESAQIAWLRLRDELRAILSDDLVAMWAHGGMTAGGPPRSADLDTYVILARRPDLLAVERIEAAHDAITRQHGVEWDAWYVLADDARGPEPPRHAFREDRRDTSWALHRADWLAGRYVPLHGSAPSDLVPPPTRAELATDLGRELEHLERHVVEGDTHPYEATYAILNGSRILHAVETGDVVLSKREAEAWALEHLPARWHPALEAALRAYDDAATPDDVRLLADEMAGFVAMVRDRLPHPTPRPAGALPRWSGGDDEEAIRPANAP
jgi:hypothetical protein